VKKGPAYKGAIGYRFLPGVHGSKPGDVRAEAKRHGSGPSTISACSGSICAGNLRDADSRALPFLHGRRGIWHEPRTDTANPPKLQHGAGTLGIGLSSTPSTITALYVRLEVRDIMVASARQ
jgi:hypothetical protein